MASDSVVVTTTKAALTGLTDGTLYTVQNRGNRRLYVAQAATEMGATDANAIVAEDQDKPNNAIAVTPVAGLNLYVWTREGTTTIAILEAA